MGVYIYFDHEVHEGHEVKKIIIYLSSCPFVFFVVSEKSAFD
jgi:hypothetical protein